MVDVAEAKRKATAGEADDVLLHHADVAVWKDGQVDIQALPLEGFGFLGLDWVGLCA
ncbi:MAG: hypothetical protein HC853_13050 [Anaerolineae bacterium]|nr:hypothetical protein [Anaerolineae bacterium]